MQLFYVVNDSEVRSYQESPHTKKLLAQSRESFDRLEEGTIPENTRYEENENTNVGKALDERMEQEDT